MGTLTLLKAGGGIGAPAVPSFLQLEDLFFLLLEDGVSKIIL